MRLLIGITHLRLEGRGREGRENVWLIIFSFLIIEYGSPLECIGSSTSPLVEAAISGHVAVILVLLENGVELVENGEEGISIT